jgi:type II secretory pathway component PulF
MPFIIRGAHRGTSITAYSSIASHIFKAVVRGSTTSRFVADIQIDHHSGIDIIQVLRPASRFINILTCPLRPVPFHGP